jgi:hypothetical protein
MMIISLLSKADMGFSFEGRFVILCQEMGYLSISQNQLSRKYIPHLQDKFAGLNGTGPRLNHSPWL